MTTNNVAEQTDTDPLGRRRYPALRDARIMLTGIVETKGLVYGGTPLVAGVARWLLVRAGAGSVAIFLTLPGTSMPIGRDEFLISSQSSG